MKIRFAGLVLLSVLLSVASLPALAKTTLSTDAFIAYAATNSQWCISLSQMEIDHFDNPDIRLLALHTLEDNKKISDQLASIVAQPSLGVDSIGNYVDSVKLNKMLEDVAKIAPQDVEHRYTEMIGSELSEASGIYKKYAEEGDNVTLRNFAAKNLDVIARDLAEAQPFLPRHAR